ncbi:dTDP-4-dehydrorhamnose 3,5-epimerase [Paenibacillus sp. CH40]|uniref:dTDP-4-dehydrorhamnose 3,5-epimerase n=1 Tax=Paenibacillus sp. CH40 TaxID=2962045 RepID=UPI0020B8BE78|nr:dTDP-4-dehydrorhamnose 3,5-epimerase [Paenibacillus sp. CH40]MCP3794836.1 dTDP-4-dehydrorhamnose 3,5-epimerase [Paenibacillus sp. CH40]
MLIHSTPLNQAAVIELEPIKDNRGYFARSFCKETMISCGISFEMTQSNVTFNENAGTLRGMHFQLPPYCEDKIVTCFNGAIYDVIIDLNRESSTFGKWYGLTLSDKNCLSLYIPKGFAHGYQTMTDNTIIHYLMSENHTPSHESGVRWNDQVFGINWPESERLIISKKDESWGDFDMNTDGVSVLLQKGE